MGRFDRAIRRAFFGTAVVWAALLFLTPLLAKAGTSVADAIALAIYIGGSVICHQRPERSFEVWGMQMPVCARCTGIYVGAAVAAIAVAIASIRLRSRWPAWSIAIASTIPSIATLVYEWTTGDMPSNGIRAASGAPIGAVVSWLVLRPFDAAQGRPERAEGRVH
jgi:uncharacterized membrane protein